MTTPFGMRPLLAAAQAVEHYEISRYGTLAAWADKLDMGDAAELLRTTLEEEKATDEKLTELAESEINVEAAEEDGEDEMPAPRRAAGGRRGERGNQRRSAAPRHRSRPGG